VSELIFVLQLIQYPKPPTASEPLRSQPTTTTEKPPSYLPYRSTKLKAVLQPFFFYCIS
jgi:hypothetical protein